MYEIIEGFLFLQHCGDSLQEVFHFEFFEVLEGNARFKDDVDPSCELIGALHANETDVLLLGSYLSTGADAVIQ